MSKHTPGPWFVDAHKNVVAEGGGLVAFPCISAGFDQEANARLIAAKQAASKSEPEPPSPKE